MKRAKTLTYAVCLILLGLSAISCAGPSDADQLTEAVQAIRRLWEPRYLSRSCFSAWHMNPRPSDYVKYFFSEIGRAEWPLAGPSDSKRFPVIPAGVSIVADQPDPDRGLQVVLRAKDDQGVVLMEAYGHSGQGPIITESWKIFPVKPEPGMSILCDVYRRDDVTGALTIAPPPSAVEKRNKDTPSV